MTVMELPVCTCTSTCVCRRVREVEMFQEIGYMQIVRQCLFLLCLDGQRNSFLVRYTVYTAHCPA